MLTFYILLQITLPETKEEFMAFTDKQRQAEIKASGDQGLELC